MSLSRDGNRAYIADPGGNMADPRRQRDPGAQAGPAGARDQPPDVEVGVDPAERDPVQRRRQAVRARVRRVHAGHDQRRQRRRGRRRADHRHRRREVAARDLQPAPAGQPAGRPRGGERRPGRAQPRPGLRGALLQHSTRDGPEDRGVLVHRLRPARVRHHRPRAPEGDRLLRGADAAARRERPDGERLRDVQARDRARAGTRSGTPTARPASTSCASRTVWPGRRRARRRGERGAARRAS